MEEQHRENREVAGLVAVIALAGLVLYLVGRSEKWSAGTALGVAGLYVSVAGFSLALLEIFRTRSATRATHIAVRQTLAGVAAGRLGPVIIQMRQVADEFESAANKTPPESETLRRTLSQWRHLAGDAKSLVLTRFDERGEEIALVDRSIELARVTKSALFGSGDLAEAALQSHQAMESALDGLGPLLEQLLPTIDEVAHE